MDELEFLTEDTTVVSERVNEWVSVLRNRYNGIIGLKITQPLAFAKHLKNECSCQSLTPPASTPHTPDRINDDYTPERISPDKPAVDVEQIKREVVEASHTNEAGEKVEYDRDHPLWESANMFDRGIRYAIDHLHTQGHLKTKGNEG